VKEDHSHFNRDSYGNPESGDAQGIRCSMPAAYKETVTVIYGFGFKDKYKQMSSKIFALSRFCSGAKAYRGLFGQQVIWKMLIGLR